MRVISDWTLDDIGIEHSQYFQGYGTAFSKYNDCAVGCGGCPAEALDDLLEMVAQCTDNCDIDQLEKDIRAAYPDFNNAELNEANSVESYLRAENPGEWVNADGDIEWDGCELHYYLGLKWN